MLKHLFWYVLIIVVSLFAITNTPVYAQNFSDQKSVNNSFVYGFHSNDPLLMSALPKKKQDWAGLTRDTGVFMATQFLAIGALYAMPVEVSGWTREDKEQPIYKRWKEHTQQIVWDKDAWYINYMLHPYWGGTYYIRAHERGFGEVGSFWFAMLLSSLFEYGGEALFEPASLQDVLVTPIMGIMVGRWFEEIRAPILLKHDRDNYEQWVLWLTDPIGIASRWLERKTHWNATFGFAHITTAYSLDNHVSQTPTLGLKVHF